MDRLTKVRALGGTTRYQYDAAGNIIQPKQSGFLHLLARLLERQAERWQHIFSILFPLETAYASTNPRANLSERNNKTTTTTVKSGSTTTTTTTTSSTTTTKTKTTASGATKTTSKSTTTTASSSSTSKTKTSTTETKPTTPKSTATITVNGVKYPVTGDVSSGTPSTANYPQAKTSGGSSTGNGGGSGNGSSTTPVVKTPKGSPEGGCIVNGNNYDLLLNELEKQVKNDLSFIEKSKNIGYYSTADALEKVIEYDEYTY